MCRPYTEQTNIETFEVLEALLVKFFGLTLKVEALRYSETSVTVYPSTMSQNIQSFVVI